jgi:diguanylate cyclase (GGDEF)-like protein/PAS domain S-box-containing protein
MGPDGPLVTAIVRDVSDRRRAEAELRANQRRLLEAEQLARVGSWEWDIPGNRVIWTDQLYRIYGLEPQSIEPTYERFLGYVHPDDRASVQARNEKAFSDHEPFEDVKRVIREDGTEILMRTQGDVICDEHGAPIRMIGVCEDVTAEHQAQRTRAMLASIVQSSGDAIHAVDRHGVITSWNPAAEALYGRTEAEMLGASIDWLLAAEHVEQDRLALQRVLRDATVERYETQRMRPDGTTVDVALTLSPISAPDGDVVGASVIARDITERKRMEHRLRYLADHDPLTDLMNGRRFLDELRTRVKDAARYGDTGAVLAFDLDGFKDVNDTHGHAAGDALIRSIAHRLRNRLRETDVLARIGGDEFVVLITHTDEVEPEHVARELMHTVRPHRLLVGGPPVRTTPSVGLARFGEHATTAEDVLARADRALYLAKQRGRDCITLADDEEEGASQRGWAPRLREAIDAGRLLLHVQPIMHLATGRIDRYEALVRLAGTDGPILPGAFIGAAERLGLIHDIDVWVLREAISLLAHHPDITLEVNVSGRNVGDHGLPGLIGDELRRTGVDPRRLVIEITETAAIANMDDARRFADEISALGCGFALDDFGAGFGSFAYLKHLPADLLKIDGEFIAGPRSEVDELIVESIVRIARQLGKETVAEYVGDAETVESLRQAGVDYAQGFHIGRPFDAGELGA